MKRAECKSCGKPIYWAPSMATEKPMPLVLNDAGNVLVELDSDRACVFGNNAETRTVRVSQPGRWWPATYASHHDDCPHGASWKGRHRPNPAQESLL